MHYTQNVRHPGYAGDQTRTQGAQSHIQQQQTVSAIQSAEVPRFLLT